MWKDGIFYYSKKILKVIAANYATLYEGFPVSWNTEIYNPWAIAEYKADFDMALSGIGRGKWSGEIGTRKFRDFRYFGDLQKTVIADIFSEEYGTSKMRETAYYFMVKYLNGEKK